MTLIKPRLALRRLVIWANGKAVYDQAFKDGVNIIRGKNSSGKSTIADFIFYALGGDFTKWKQEASLCDYVMAEIEVNDATLTTKRTIQETTRQPMMVFWGTYGEANSSAVEGWHIFPFQRGKIGSKESAKESFSQILFRALDFPEVRGDFDSNITMHQILRLLFIDQLSPVDSLLRTEQFDSHLTRTTIGDLLLGVYDDQMYSSQLALIKKDKELEGVISEYDNVLQVFGEAEQETDLDSINAEIEALGEQRKKVVQALREVQNFDIPLDEEDRMPGLQQALIGKKQELAALQDNCRNLELEVEDSREFLKSLSARLGALDDSNRVRNFLGDLPLTNCPQCLAPILPVNSDHPLCPLCKEKPFADLEASHAARMHQELAQQIKESEFLLSKNETQLEQLKRNLPGLSEEVNRLSNEYDTAVSTVKSKRDAHLDQLWRTMGQLDTKIEFLHKHAKGIAVLDHLRKRKLLLESDISRLRLLVKERKQKQEARQIQARSVIEEKVLYLLHNDLPLEETFKQATEVNFDFGANNFSVNGENQFSASSMVYLKNSIHLAILWASLELSYFRYPRILICDDIEDKGMHPSRSQNFQKLIVSLSQEFAVTHQIIFTTSMIDPDLDKLDLCVGPSYGPENKTLDFS